MDRDRRKAVIISVIVGLVVIGPLVACSPWGVSRMREVALNNAGKPWAANLYLRSAAISGYTLQRDDERAGYQAFYETFTSDPRRGYAKYMVAVCLDRDHRGSKREAAQTYEEFVDEFEDDEAFQTLPEWQDHVNDARTQIQRLRQAGH